MLIRWLKRLFAPLPRELCGYRPHLPPRRAPPPMPATKPARDFTDWDVAQAATSEPAHEPGRIEYRFLGITGMEDE
ncbi:MAG TPA: hypothetical protein VF534_01955 [Paraburkholderia sp.]